MGREDDVRRALKESRAGSRKPATKLYIAIFLVLAAVLSVYLLLSSFYPQPYGPVFPQTSPVQAYDVASNEEAQQTSDYVNNGAQESLSELDSIGTFLGV